MLTQTKFIFAALIVSVTFISVTGLCFAEEEYSHTWNSHRAGSHAPIGVMGDHLHEKGEFMLSYRFMRMQMDNNLVGSRSISEAEILESFMVTQTDMDMEMHMLGGMYAPTDRLTLTAMLPYVNLSMNHVTRSSARFQTNSEGLGDGMIGALYGLADFGEGSEGQKKHRVILNSALSIPFGDIDERDDTPAAAQAQLPYPMQLGSGTVDFKPGLTYLGQSENWSWGAQGIGTFRIGRNSNDYSLGDRFESTAWLALEISKNLSASFRSAWSVWNNIDGADPLLNPNVVPTADPLLRGGRRVDLGAGLNFLFTDGPLKAFRLAGEFLFPVYENLDGPQLETEWNATFGIQKSFG